MTEQLGSQFWPPEGLFYVLFDLLFLQIYQLWPSMLMQGPLLHVCFDFPTESIKRPHIPTNFRQIHSRIWHCTRIFVVVTNYDIKICGRCIKSFYCDAVFVIINVCCCCSPKLLWFVSKILIVNLILRKCFATVVTTHCVQ